MPDLYRDAINRLAKWRMIFAGWQLGTRPKGDPESDAVRDHREGSLIMRAEVTAISRILLEKQIITQEDLARIIAEEAEALCQMLEQKFPGIKATDTGITLDQRAAETMKGWRP